MIISIVKYRLSGLFLLQLLTLINTSCGIYSFSGTSIPADVETFSVSLFKNNTDLAPPLLSQILSDALRDKLNNDTNLDLVERDADLQFEGIITDYKVDVASVTSDQTSALNRLSITIKVEYLEKEKIPKGWPKNFTRFADYDSNVSLSSVEDQLIEEITEQLVLDVFNDTVVNW